MVRTGMSTTWGQNATRFNVHKFYVQPTQFICVFCVDIRTNGDYFPTLVLLLCCSMYCLCVNVYCHRVTTQLQLTNISYHNGDGACSLRGTG